MSDFCHGASASIFFSKTIGIIRFLGVPNFWSVRLLFTIVNISKAIFNFCYDDGFLKFTSFWKLVYFQWETTFLPTTTSSWFSTDFQNLNISEVILKIWPVDGFIGVVYIPDLFHLYFRIVESPKENHTFCYVHGFDVLDQFFPTNSFSYKGSSRL